MKIDNQIKRKTILVSDSQPAIDWLTQEYVKPRTKFLGLILDRIKERINEKDLKIFKIEGEHNPADPLTKPVYKTKVNELKLIMKDALKMTDIIWLVQ